MDLSAFKRVALKSPLPVGAALLAGCIFVADTFTNLEIAVPVLYTAVVLLAVRFRGRRGVLAVAASCVGLTLLSDALTAPGGSTETGFINTTISIAAIVTTTYLALKIESTTAAVYEARAQLAHLGRVATLGELTASIAHEVNQPLAATVINGNACLRWLAAEPPDLTEARLAAQAIVKDASRAGEVIARVRALTQRQPVKSIMFDMNGIIRDTLALADGEIRKNRITAEASLMAESPRLQGDPVQLQQVVLNLLLNAIDAITLAPEGGPRNLLVSSEMSPQGLMLVSVQDSGSGLKKNQLDRLFEAFYTSKPRGMGMGLAISRSIIESHGGRIWAEPDSRRGAVFRFSLPTNRG